jgi:hypothetical protein
VQPLVACRAPPAPPQALVNAGADVSYPEPSLHETVLMVAAREGFVNIVRYLASLDAVDIGHRNKEGATAESIAEAEGHLEVVAALQVRHTPAHTQTHIHSNPHTVAGLGAPPGPSATLALVLRLCAPPPLPRPCRTRPGVQEASRTRALTGPVRRSEGEPVVRSGPPCPLNA